MPPLNAYPARRLSNRLSAANPIFNLYTNGLSLAGVFQAVLASIHRAKIKENCLSVAPQLLLRVLAKTGDNDRVSQERVSCPRVLNQRKSVKIVLPRNNHTKRRSDHERQDKD
jgi:hypothetical protein